MVENIVNSMVDFFKDTVPSELIVFVISLFPILELRGGMIAAKLLDVEFIRAFVICYIGNILPIPFILLFIRKIFQFLKKFDKIGNLIEKLEIRSMRKSENVKKYRLWGLLAFVAIPLPGTGGWTGSLIAALLDMRISHSFPVIAFGILIANIIMSIFSYGLLGAIGL